MPVELISFGTGADWISKLWGRLTRSRKKLKDELEAINSILITNPLELAKYYVEPDCQESNPMDRHDEDFLVAREPVIKIIDRFFERKIYHPGDSQMFVLSDAGMGKTALLSILKLMHLTAFWPQKTDCVLKKLGEETLDEIRRVERKSGTILLLDSLDEDPMAYGRVKERLLDILNAAQPFHRVIITCRTHFFPEVDPDPLERHGMVSIGGFNCPIKYLSFFSDDRVRQYLAKRFPRKYRILPNTKKIEEARKVIEKMGSLRCRPMLLAYIEDLMASPVIQYNDSEFKIYDALIQSWLRRDEAKNRIPQKDLLDACIILAAHLQINGKRHISEEDLDQLIEKIATVKPVKRIDIKGRSLINRNSEGAFRFSHYSIQEFLTTKLLLGEKPVYKPKSPIPVTDFMFRMIAMAGKPPLFPELLDCKGLKLQKADLRNIKLAGLNLECIDLAMANLTGADLQYANFRNANLKDAILHNIDMRKADFSEANLEGCQIQNARLGGACFIGARLTGAYIEFSSLNEIELPKEELNGTRLVNKQRNMKFTYIPSGEFMMGSPDEEKDRSYNEILHKVIITKGFYMQTTPVTQAQWESVMGTNSSEFKKYGKELPVENVSWTDVQEFTKKLNQMENTDKYRLPTEAEWEYACRAGSKHAYCFGNDSDELIHVAWYEKNSNERPHPVGQLEPNNWGLHDMHGNVWEWVEDWYGDYSDGSVVDPKGPLTSSGRVLRGGSWIHNAWNCRSAYRGGNVPGGRDQRIGFRLALSPGQ